VHRDFFWNSALSVLAYRCFHGTAPAYLAESLPSPLLAVPNVTTHPSTASVPITVLLYDGPLLCGFNVVIKGLRIFSQWTSVRTTDSKVRSVSVPESSWRRRPPCRPVQYLRPSPWHSSDGLHQRSSSEASEPDLQLPCCLPKHVNLLCIMTVYGQKAQLSQRDRAMLCVIEYFAKSLKVMKWHPWAGRI